MLWLRMPLPFALDHINLWLLADDDGATLIDCGYGDAATRAVWERHFATTLRERPLRRIIATHCHPDHVGNAAWLSARFGAPVAMTHAEFLTAHAIAGQHAGHGVASTIDLFRKHGMAAEHIAALDDARQSYRRGVPELPEAFDRLLAGDIRRAGGVPGRSSRATDTRPSTPRCSRLSAGRSISGDMLLPRITTNVSVWAPEPDGDPLGGFSIRSRPSRRCHPTRWCCPRTACRSAASRCASRSCAPTTRAPRRARGCDRRCRRAAHRRRPRPGAVPAPTRFAAAFLRDGRGDRPSQPPLAPGAFPAVSRRAGRFALPHTNP